jgi:hypothetical protein
MDLSFNAPLEEHAKTSSWCSGCSTALVAMVVGWRSTLFSANRQILI